MDCECLHCGHKWISVVESPGQCPSCRSPNWDKVPHQGRQGHSPTFVNRQPHEAVLPTSFPTSRPARKDRGREVPLIGGIQAASSKKGSGFHHYCIECGRITTRMKRDHLCRICFDKHKGEAK